MIYLKKLKHRNLNNHFSSMFLQQFLGESVTRCRRKSNSSLITNFPLCCLIGRQLQRPQHPQQPIRRQQAERRRSLCPSFRLIYLFLLRNVCQYKLYCGYYCVVYSVYTYCVVHLWLYTSYITLFNPNKCQTTNTVHKNNYRSHKNIRFIILE